MNNLIKVNYDNKQPTVLGRDLHKALGVESNYTTWFKRMCEYGFSEDKDYIFCFPNLESKNQHGGQNKIDHQLTIPMAKEICMLQRSEKGKMFRQYFIAIEEQWNSPDAVMARALQLSHKKLESLSVENLKLLEENSQLKENNSQLKDDNTTLYIENKCMKTEELYFKDKEIVRKVVNIIAHLTNSPQGYIWTDLYDQLLYKYGICLKSRKPTSSKNKSLVSRVREDEWMSVQRCLLALCEQYEISVSDVFHKVFPKMNDTVKQNLLDNDFSSVSVITQV